LLAFEGSEDWSEMLPAKEGETFRCSPLIPVSAPSRKFPAHLLVPAARLCLQLSMHRMSFFMWANKRPRFMDSPLTQALVHWVTQTGLPILSVRHRQLWSPCSKNLAVLTRGWSTKQVFDYQARELSTLRKVPP
jgi:hypothetical protein